VLAPIPKLALTVIPHVVALEAFTKWYLSFPYYSLRQPAQRFLHPWPAPRHTDPACSSVQALDGVNTILALMNNAMQMLGMIGLLVESIRLQSVRKLLRDSSGRLASAFSSSFRSFRSSLPRMATAGVLLQT
jgi:hypothetical protein